jgi:DeoR/GlpR family transcriptional regulator of sugar metabolism
MFAHNRRQEIVDILTRLKRVEVSQLSHDLDVSEVTIRKDLEGLEQMGVLLRTHGGAVLKEQLSRQVVEERDQPLDAVEIIARIIPFIVDDGDLVYLGTQAICVAIARRLREKSALSVITNNVSAALELGDNPDINVIMPGGQMTKRVGVGALTGMEVTAFLAGKSVDKAIISADGVKLSTGYSVQDLGTARVYQAVVQHADAVIVAVESDCFNKNALAEIGPLTIANTIVSNESMPEDYMQYYYDNGIKVFTSYDLENL